MFESAVLIAKARMLGTVDSMGRRHVPRIDWCQVLEAWRRIGHQHKVAKHLGIGQTHVSRILVACGISVGKGGNCTYATPLPEIEIAERYRSGESCRKIAESLGVADEVVRIRLKKLGVSRRPRGSYELKKENNSQWKGGRSDSRKKDTNMHFYRRQAYEVAAICLGQPLRRGWVIHHVDENWRNNDPKNLVVFESQSTHVRHHQRLLKLQLEGGEVDAIQLALESGGRLLPQPRAPIQLSHDTSPPDPSRTSELLSCDRTMLRQQARKKSGLPRKPLQSS